MSAVGHTSIDHAHDGHAHDDHGHHHKQTFITKYIFSTDHKMIAKQYLITGLLMGVIGIGMSVLFRMQLAWPGEPFWIFEFLLGKWAPGGVMSQEVYLALVTIHGTIMVFFVLTAGLSGTFSNLLIPLQIGARDMASGFLNMISYWLFFLSSIIMLSSLFVEAGPASAGWTIYPPLSALPQAIARGRDLRQDFGDRLPRRHPALPAVPVAGDRHERRRRTGVADLVRARPHRQLGLRPDVEDEPPVGGIDAAPQPPRDEPDTPPGLQPR